MFKKLLIFCTLISLLIGVKIDAQCASLYPEEKENYVIVIDPGHGGDNWGTTSNENFKEKEITMKTAKALVEELEQYDNVTVYLTHEKDVDVSLKKRAIFAQEKEADFLFSIHYNASNNHTMFGSEVWIPVAAPYHSYGYKYAYLQQLEMQDMGLFSRGVRSRRNEEGTDYYGIIRECVEREIPAVIIEHCYIDEERDASYCDEDADYAEFGRRDAIAIAKYLGLVETDTDSDMKKLLQIGVNDTIAYTYEDTSVPEICEISVEAVDFDKNELTIKVDGKDSDTPLMYYDYSLDGGDSFSKLYPWIGSDVLKNTYENEISVVVPIIDWDGVQLIVRAYNKFDLYKASNLLTSVEIAHAKELAEATPVPTTELDTQEKENNSVPVISEEETTSTLSMKRFGLLFLFVILWILLIFVIGRTIYSFVKKK